MAEKEQEFELNLSQYVQILSRRRWIIVLVFVPVAGIAAAYAFLTPPVYRATTVINIEKEIGSAVQKDNIVKGQDDAYFSTQHKLIKSDSALNHVFDELNLSGKKGFSDGVKSLEGAVTVLPESGTRLCDVSADSTDPRLAVAISKALSQYFVDQNPEQQALHVERRLGRPAAPHERRAASEKHQRVPSLPSSITR